ncbi:FAD-dependent monooxygenase sdnN [Botrytis cinerea]
MYSFKVVIVGAGPVGLTTAHALSKAGIDFVVLERRQVVVEDVGASLVLAPQSLRVMSQLQLLDKLTAISTDLVHATNYTMDGKKFKEAWPFEVMKQNHGSAPRVFHRAELLQAIYQGLRPEDKSRVLTNKKITSIESDKAGVRVHCTDGSTYEGSIVIGADGVHSQTRQLMRSLALQTSPGDTVNDEEPFTTEYRTMWCSFPKPENSEIGLGSSTDGSNASVQYLTSTDRAWIFIYEHLERPTKKRAWYSQEDVEAFAAKHAEMPINDHLKVKDVFAKKYHAGMANLEEGIIEHWSWERIVLVGDAAHKFTPNHGQGLNNGIQDAVVLVNELHRCIASVGASDQPSKGELSIAFQRYQSTRTEYVKTDYNHSATVTRMSAWPNLWYRLLDRYIIPLIPGFDNMIMNYFAAPHIAQGQILEFIHSEEPFKGKVPWVYSIET